MELAPHATSEERLSKLRCCMHFSTLYEESSEASVDGQDEQVRKRACLIETSPRRKLPKARLPVPWYEVTVCLAGASQ